MLSYRSFCFFAVLIASMLNSAEARHIFFVGGAKHVSHVDVRSDTSGVRINHMSPTETPVNNQIWSIQESELGWAFFAEEEGILALRGDEWELITTPNASTVRSLAIHHSSKGETLYYGEQDDFGYVHIDSVGIGKAVSLKTLVPDSLSFGNVWNVHAVGEEILFQSRNHLFILKDKKIEVIQSESGFHNAFSIYDNYLIREFGDGLSVYRNGDLRHVDTGGILEKDLIAGITSAKEEIALIWTQSSGVLELNLSDMSVNSGFPYHNSLKEISDDFRLYNAVRLDSDRVVVATLGGGLLVVNNTGRLLKRLTRNSGFPDDSQNYLHVSRYGGLWVGLDNEGVAYLDSDIVRLSYSSRNGITGYINDLDLIDGSLVVSTGSGVYKSISSESVFAGDNFFYSTTAPVPQFSRVNTTPIIWNTTTSGRFIYSASESGLVRSERAQPGREELCSILDSGGETLPIQAFSLLDVPSASAVLVGMSDGLGVVKDSQGPCLVTRIKLGDDEVEVRSIEILEDQVWIGTAFHGLMMVPLDDLGRETRTVKLSRDHPPGRNDVVKWGNRLFGYSSFGIYDIDVVSDVIHWSRINGPLQAIDDISVVEFVADSEGWIVTRDSVINAKLVHGQLEEVKTPSALIFEKSSTSSILEDSTGVVWFNNGSELIRYDPRYDVEDHKVFNAQISSVKRASDGELLFGGFYRADDGGIASEQPEWAIPTLDYDSRNLTFRFAATEFINPKGVQFRYRIDGSEESEWSEWSDEREAMTASIDEGAYAIVVQAKDEIGRMSTTASYQFVILPPWYRTIWAYLAYLILAATAMGSGQKYVHMRRAHKLAAEQKKELEREREVVKKLSEANDRLMQANKLKDEFLATTSHELRTPLTAILGFTSVLKEEIPQDADYREFLDIIEDSGSRLMDTLNSLLDLAKLRAGILEINMEDLDLYQVCFQEIVQLQTAAQKKGLKLKVRRPDQPIHARADVYGLNRILHNLVGNAVKFTDEGSIEVWFKENADSIDLHVTDTGIGIDAEFLPELFNAFIQESDGLSRTHEGTGLGLAITSGIASLMDASIRVESSKGEGSDFVVTLKKAEVSRQRPRRFAGMGNTASA